LRANILILLCQSYSMKCIYSTIQISKLNLTLCTFSISSSVTSLFLILYFYSLILLNLSPIPTIIGDISKIFTNKIISLLYCYFPIPFSSLLLCFLLFHFFSILFFLLFSFSLLFSIYCLSFSFPLFCWMWFTSYYLRSDEVSWKS